MALTPELDALAAKVANLESLISNLDGVQAINVTIGTFVLIVDPATNRDAYNKGADVLRTVAQQNIADLHNAIASTAIVQVNDTNISTIVNPPQ